VRQRLHAVSQSRSLLAAAPQIGRLRLGLQQQRRPTLARAPEHSVPGLCSIRDLGSTRLDPLYRNRRHDRAGASSQEGGLSSRDLVRHSSLRTSVPEGLTCQRGFLQIDRSLAEPRKQSMGCRWRWCPTPRGGFCRLPSCCCGSKLRGCIDHRRRASQQRDRAGAQRCAEPERPAAPVVRVQHPQGRMTCWHLPRLQRRARSTRVWSRATGGADLAVRCPRNEPCAVWQPR